MSLNDASVSVEEWAANFIKSVSRPLGVPYRTVNMALCYIKSYPMICPVSGEDMSDCGLLSMSCHIAQGTIFMAYSYIRQPYIPRDASLADQRTWVLRYRQPIVTHCKHGLYQKRHLKLRNYQQLAPTAQFETQSASSLHSIGIILPRSWSTVDFVTRDFHSLISRQHSQTNRCSLYTLFLTS